jgi:predicted nucleic acid-binding Zn ribbon protein
MAIAEAMKRYLTRSGLRDRLEQTDVVEEWPRLVGPQIAKVAAPQSVTRDGTLFVLVASAAWMQELQLMTPTILARLGERSKAVKRIIWRADG